MRALVFTLLGLLAMALSACNTTGCSGNCHPVTQTFGAPAPTLTEPVVALAPETIARIPTSATMVVSRTSIECTPGRNTGVIAGVGNVSMGECPAGSGTAMAMSVGSPSDMAELAAHGLMPAQNSLENEGCLWLKSGDYDANGTFVVSPNKGVLTTNGRFELTSHAAVYALEAQPGACNGGPFGPYRVITLDEAKLLP